MKKLALIFIFNCFCFACVAQRVVLSDSATLDLPEGMVKAQKKKLLSLTKKRYRNTEYLSRRVKNNFNKFYLADGIVIFINTGSVERQPGILKTLKLASDDVGLSIPNYSSKIENIAGREVFVVDWISEGSKMFNFTTVNNAGDFIVVGFVQYETGDKEKARTVLENLIKGIKFNGE